MAKKAAAKKKAAPNKKIKAEPPKIPLVTLVGERM